MRRKKHNSYLSPQLILSTLASPLDAFPSHQLPRSQPQSLSYTQTAPQPHSTSTVSSQTLSIFDIPLIFDQICSTLSSENIWTCMRVSKSWQALARPHHWRSIHSVLNKSSTKPLPRIASVNVPLVRSLTLNVFHTDLLDVPFSNLVRLQLYYRKFHLAATSAKESRKALALICRNTRLQELRVNCAWRLLRHVDSGVLQFLYSSRLRSLDLEGIEYFCLEKVQAILAHCPDTLQELRLVFLNFLGLDFDDDDNLLRLNARAAVVPRILPNLRVLTLDIPNMDEPLEIAVCDLIQSCSRLQEINLVNLRSLSNIFTSLTKNSPSVNTVKLHRTHHISEADMIHFLEPCPQLCSLEMVDIAGRLERVIPTIVDRFGSTLQELTIYVRDVSPNSHEFIATILAHCSCLKNLSVGRSLRSSLDGIVLQDLLAVEWASTSLESLCLPIKGSDVEIEQDHLLQEWRQHRYAYLDPDEYDPDGIIARSRVLVDLLSRLYRRLQAQPRLTSLQLAWHGMWFTIPLEFAVAFSNGQLTEMRLGWMKLFLNPLSTASKIALSVANKKKKAEEERTLMDKLCACNISVVHIEASRMEYRDNKDNEVDYDPPCSTEDQEYSTYKSRKERTRRTQRK